jgi:dsDNA-specific endonuclease/ATPase MutS2
MTLGGWIKRLCGAGGRTRVDAEGAGADSPEDDADVDPFNPFPEPIALEITDVFDLHTLAPRDVGRAVEEYLIESRRAGFRSVRIIHGKGRGVQREMVRKILARTDFVVSFTDAPPAAGGFGATVAHLTKDEGGGMRDEMER